MPSQETQLIDNRYQILNQIGAGGMGAVYRAMDRLNGQVVSLKRVLIQSDRLTFGHTPSTENEEVSILSLTREFKLLASLRHPNIVSVLDYGFDSDSNPYFTMNLIENATTITEASKGQSFQVKLDLLLQLLQALVYLHRRDIVHRDLKPDNILVQNHQVKVLDFGLAINQETEKSDHLVGTLAYMSPEVLHGQTAKRESDLYAFAVIAYEVLTGDYLYGNSNDYVRLINSITNDIPNLEKLAQQRPELTYILDRLLEKEPDHRWQNAYDVIIEICDATKTPRPVETIAVRDSFLKSAKFVGREKELSQLTDAIDNALHNNIGSAWLIGGESGVGKSRFVDEIRTHALVRGMTVLRGNSTNDNNKLYELWRPIMRYLTISMPLSALEAGVLQVVVPDISTLMGYDIPPPPAVDADVAQERLTNIISQVIKRFNQPLLIIVEDLQWAKEDLNILKQVIQDVKESQIVVIGNYRNDERQDLPEQLPQMALIQLPRLNVNEIKKLSRQILGNSGKSEELINLLKRETEGNAFFVIEVMRSLADEFGQLDYIDVQTLPKHVQANSINQIMQGRLKRIKPEHYNLIRYAALMGRYLDLPTLTCLYDDNLEDWLLSNLGISVLELQDGDWRFSHDKLREALLQQISSSERPPMAQEIARAIEKAHPNEPEWYPKLASLWELAENLAKEVHYRHLSGELALQYGANIEARNQYLRILELKDSLDFSASQYFEYLYNLGKAYKGLAMATEAIHYMEEALKVLERPMPKNTVSATMRILAQVIEQYLRRLGMYKSYEKDESKAERIHNIIKVYDNVHRSYFAANNTLSMMICFLEMANFSERLQDNSEIARAHSTISIVTNLIPLHSASDFYYQSGLRHANDAQDLLVYPVAYTAAANRVIAKGEFNTAREYTEKSFDYLQKIGDDVSLGDTLVMAAWTEFYSGDFELSLKLCQDLRKITERNNNLSHHSIALSLQTLNRIYLGALDNIVEDAEAALNAADKGQDMTGWVTSFAALTSLYHHLDLDSSFEELIDTRLETFLSYTPATHYMGFGYAETMRILLEKLEQNPENAERWKPLIEKAFARLKRSATLFPMIGRARFHLEAQYKSLSGQTNAASKLFEQALAHKPSKEMVVETALTHFDFAKHLDRTNQVELGTAHFDTAATIFNDLNMELMLQKIPSD